MDLVLVLVAAAVFPVVCLAFVLWMGRIEDTLPASVARSLRRPDPPPVLRVPVRRAVTASTVARAPAATGVRIPAQRVDAPAPAVPIAGPAVPIAAPAVPPAPAAPAGT